MVKLAGYETGRLIFESSRTLVYQSHRLCDRQPVILKLLKGDYPSLDQLRRLQQEYEITRRFQQTEGIIQVLEIAPYRRSQVLVFEDFGGRSLRHWLTQSPFNLEAFFEIALQAAENLGKVHAAQVIHKDINPTNLIYDPESRYLKIIDFGISSLFSRETPSLQNPARLEGTLAYVSPEQTGRMNRALDYRSDFYSLGVTFYELLTQQLPFDRDDPLDLVYCHLAQQPLSPHEINPQVPLSLSQVVMKLLAKNAEDRYQSTLGLCNDLRHCQLMTRQGDFTQSLVVGQRDHANQFQIPQKLYGRAVEVAILQTIFDRVVGAAYPPESRAVAIKAELLLISGYAGVGKSVLVQELYRSVTQQHGYFITGKYDQLQRNVPYSGLIQAFQSLFDQLLTETDEALAYWRDRLRQALGTNAQVVIDVLPSLKAVMGPQPAVTPLAPTEAQNRFNLVFQNFIKVFTAPAHPLVIFLDDLQWADTASLRLIATLMKSAANQALFLIGAYRDNEVTAAHPLSQMLEDMQSQGEAVHQIQLQPLTLPDITQLISDTLGQPTDTVAPLAALVALKTGGNPFFMGEFLKSLHSESLIDFDHRQGMWCWDLEQIRLRNLTDNVVALIADKIQQLPPQTQVMLKLAACVGSRIPFQSLLKMGQDPQLQSVLGAAEIPEAGLGIAVIAQALNPAIAQGLLIPSSKGYSPATVAEAEIVGRVPDACDHYWFAHDRIQQAAYSLLSSTQQQMLHCQLGWQLWQQAQATETVAERLFEIVDQLNQGRSQLTDLAEKLILADLNRQAGARAVLATAYISALEYCHTGLDLLPSNSWDTHYDLTLALHTATVEAEYLNTHFEAAERLTEITLAHTSDPLEQSRLYETKLRFYIAQNQMQLALETGLLALERLGIELTDAQPAVTDIEALGTAPTIESPEVLAALRILVVLHAPAYIANPALLLTLDFTTVQLCIEHGHSPLAPFAFAYYGLLLCGVFGKIDQGYRYGQLAQKLLKTLDSREIACKTEVLINACIRHWKEPAAIATQDLLEAMQIGLDTGDLEYACTAITTWCAATVLVGNSLEQIQTQYQVYFPMLTTLKQDFYLNYFRLWNQVVANLQGQATDAAVLDGEYFEATRLIPHFEQTQNYTALFAVYLAQTLLSYLAADYPAAIAAARTACQYQQSAAGLITFTQINFYQALALLAHYDQVDPATQTTYLSQINQSLQQLQTWANHAPMNFQHKYDLVVAETARVHQQIMPAMDAYNRAIQGARRHGYLHEEAIACELAAKFHLSQNLGELAEAFFHRSYQSYLYWGATVKAQQLKTQHHQFFGGTYSNEQSVLARYSTRSSTSTGTTISNTSESLIDFASVIRAAQAISSEIMLDKLLETLMEILLKNAAAQTGYLLLEHQGKLYIEASYSTLSNHISILQSIPLETAAKAQMLSTGIINFVARTQETILVGNATQLARFQSDPYIQAVQPKSILCTPMLAQGQLNGILYLENNLTTDAFTPRRLEVLNLLSTQASIAINNAQFYQNLSTLNQAYERFVPRQFLQLLGKDSITAVQLGDHVEQTMSVLFSDIRDFTRISEQISPEDNFKLINAFLSRMDGVIARHNGFIDKYIGDAVMALFSGSADDAVQAGIAMLQQLQHYNQERLAAHYEPLKIGIGINTGRLMLGTVGGTNRMDGTVISDAVNLAARLEGLTKILGCSLLVSQATFTQLESPEQYSFRLVDRVIVKGKSVEVVIYEVFDADPVDLREAKQATKQQFEQGVLLYSQQKFREAEVCFQNCLASSLDDQTAQRYVERCQQQSA